MGPGALRHRTGIQTRPGLDRHGQPLPMAWPQRRRVQRQGPGAHLAQHRDRGVAGTTVDDGMACSGNCEHRAQPLAHLTRVDGADPQDPAATPGRHAAYLGPQPELHPRKPLGRQLMASLDAAGYDRRDAERRTGALLRAVGLGGAHATHPQRMGVLERHRAALALALTTGARVVVADRVGEESDTFVRAELRALLREARDYLDLAIVHLTQDVGGVADLADRVVVLDGGRVVEDAPVRGFFSALAAFPGGSERAGRAGMSSCGWATCRDSTTSTCHLGEATACRPTWRRRSTS